MGETDCSFTDDKVAGRKDEGRGSRSGALAPAARCCSAANRPTPVPAPGAIVKLAQRRLRHPRPIGAQTGLEVRIARAGFRLTTAADGEPVIANLKGGILADVRRPLQTELARDAARARDESAAADDRVAAATAALDKILRDRDGASYADGPFAVAVADATETLKKRAAETRKRRPFHVA